jgi:hypothetical protein
LNDEELANYYDRDTDGYYVNFIVRLAALTKEPAAPRLEADGCPEWTFRKPQIFPPGIKSDFE